MFRKFRFAQIGKLFRLKMRLKKMKKIIIGIFEGNIYNNFFKKIIEEKSMQRNVSKLKNELQGYVKETKFILILIGGKKSSFEDIIEYAGKERGKIIYVCSENKLKYLPIFAVTPQNFRRISEFFFEDNVEKKGKIIFDSFEKYEIEIFDIAKCFGWEILYYIGEDEDEICDYKVKARIENQITSILKKGDENNFIFE